MYLIVLDYAFSVLLFQHAPNDRQKLIYYVSKTLEDVETHYYQVEHMMLTLLFAVKKTLSILLGTSSNNSDKSTIESHLAQARFFGVTLSIL